LTLEDCLAIIESGPKPKYGAKKEVKKEEVKKPVKKTTAKKTTAKKPAAKKPTAAGKVTKKK